MDNIKNDGYYRDRLLNDLNVISRHMTGVSEDDFASDELLQDAMMFRLIQASENARKLSDRFKADYPRCPGEMYTASETASCTIMARWICISYTSRWPRTSPRLRR